MRFQRKVAMALTSVVAIGALSACGSSPSSNGTTPVASGPKQLQIFSWWTGVASSKALGSLIKVFNDKYPSIKVINEAVAGGGWFQCQGRSGEPHGG